jgi:hypothetical protein
MSFIPAVPANHLPRKGTNTFMHTKPAAKLKLVKRQLPRARKARARLRQNKQRAAAVRTN